MPSDKCASVWDAIENTPEQAALMRERSSLMMRLVQVVGDMTLPEAACIFGVSHRRVADLMRGKIDLFSIADLTRMAEKVGCEVVTVTTLSQVN